MFMYFYQVELEIGLMGEFSWHQWRITAPVFKQLQDVEEVAWSTNYNVLLIDF